jgi:hypothetical protein
MRYFHRTSLSVDAALSEADRYFGDRMSPGAHTDRTRTYASAIGTVALTVRPEGGHYTLITVTTDNVGESEVDKFAKRFLGTVHGIVHKRHKVRGAY